VGYLFPLRSVFVVPLNIFCLYLWILVCACHTWMSTRSWPIQMLTRLDSLVQFHMNAKSADHTPVCRTELLLQIPVYIILSVTTQFSLIPAMLMFVFHTYISSADYPLQPTVGLAVVDPWPPLLWHHSHSHE